VGERKPTGFSRGMKRDAGTFKCRHLQINLYPVIRYLCYHIFHDHGIQKVILDIENSVRKGINGSRIPFLSFRYNQGMPVNLS